MAQPVKQQNGRAAANKAARKKENFKAHFEQTSFYAACAIPVLGGIGGAYLGAVSGLLGPSVGAAVTIGIGGAAVGALAGLPVGAAGFFAANSLYKNKEYIVMAMAFAVTAPFALALKGLKAVKNKIFGRKEPQAETPPADTVSPIKTGKDSGPKTSAKPDFDTNAPKTAPKPKTPPSKKTQPRPPKR